MDIKVQRGVAIIPKNETTVTVELKKVVNPEKAVVLHGGSICNDYNNTSSNILDVRIVLIDSKHIEVKRAYKSCYTVEVAWQVVDVIPDGKPQEPEKEREIDWSKVPVDTPVLVRDRDENNWVKRYFAFYVPIDLENRFVTFNNGFTSREEQLNTAWKYCKLAPEVDPTPYYKD